jgi:hypothetical protein
MLESKFQSSLIKNIKDRFPGCVVLKNDANYKQGIPDLTVFYKDKWAWLETKRSRNASHQPLQDYYIDRGNEMSFARFVSPENESEVLDELQQAFQPRRKTRVSRSL